MATDFSRAVQVAAAFDLVVLTQLFKKGVLDQADLAAIAAGASKMANDPEAMEAQDQWIEMILGISGSMKP
ncbi:MAG: hypothetical protein ACK5SX_15205 [Sandaracinobacter sp.]